MALLADDDSQKITHDYCQYRNGTPQENCGNCHHYTGNSCEIVQNPIAPNMVCNFHCPAQQQTGLLNKGY
jgi:hypothetical protein